MRTNYFLAGVLFAAVTLAPSMAATTEPSSTEPSSTEPSAENPASSCDIARKTCYADKTQTGSFGERYVPLDDVQACEAAYQACIGQH